MDNARELRTYDGLATLQRPRFTPGLLLEDEDLTAGVTYTRDLTRLLLRSLFGCGVVCGLKVTASRTCNGSRLTITVGSGLGFDCLGNAIEVPTPQTVQLDFKCDPPPDDIWIAVCYYEKCCRPKDVSCSADADARPESTRVRSGFQIKLYDAAPRCACRCRTKDDDTPKDEHPDDCCPEAEAKTGGKSATQYDDKDQGQGEEKPEDKCPCYSAHYRGDCAGDCCGCTCIVIGRVRPNTPRTEDNEPAPSADYEVPVNRDMVRLVRPVLTGYLKCRFPEDQAHGDVTPAPGTPETVPT